MGPSGDGTLTADEVTIAKRMYGGTHRDWNDLASEQRYTGAKYGSEADWSPLFADNGGYGPFIGHYVYSLLTPPFDWRRDINWDDVYDYAKAVLTPVTAAPSPDIRRFTARGGKLIQMAGWNDSVVPPDGSVDYFFVAGAVGADAEPAEPGGRPRDREADAAERRGPRQRVRRPGAAVPPPVPAAGHRPLRRQHRPELDRRRHARAAEGLPRRRPPRRQRR